jgi:hypothetical protein
MSSVIIAGNTSGTITLDAPDVAGTTVLTLPATSGSFITTTGGVAPGTAGNVLTSNGTTWTSASNPPAFVAGTRLGFQQTSAPTGWTKDTTAAINDSILRLVTGTASSGGSTAFSTFNAQTAVGATTLSTAQIPSHAHSFRTTGGTTSSNFQTASTGGTTTINTGSTGGGGSHNHSITTNIKFYDFIIASKD